MKKGRKRSVKALEPGCIYVVMYSFFASYRPLTGFWEQEAELFVNADAKVLFLSPTEQVGYKKELGHELRACRFLNLQDSRVIYANIDYKESMEYFQQLVV